MKRLLALIALWLAWGSCAYGMERAQGACEEGGFTVNTQGLLSTTKVQRSFVSCTVTVYNAGTLTLATIYNDNALVPTPKANPFTSAADGYWFFYAAGGKYDVRFSGSDVPLAFTRGDWLLCDPFGPNADADCTSGAEVLHNLLSETHPDTVPYSPPEIGDLIRGNLDGLWERLGTAQVGEVLSLIDVGGGQPYPEWVWPSTLDTCTSTQINGSEIGCEHEINFIEGTNITMTGTDDSDNDRTNITINATGGGSLVCDPTSIVDIYVDTGGSDITGDGSIGNPYETIQHAIDTDVPVFVGAKYYIHLLSAGTYAGFAYTGRTDCAGGITCGNAAPDYLTPFGTGLSIIGSEDGIASDTWIINTASVVDGLKLYLQGVEVSTGAVGLTAQNRAQVALAAVHFYNNNLGLLAATWSQVYLIPGIYVEDDTFSALATADNFDPSSDGFEVTEDSVLTDSCPDGDNANLGTYLGCASNGTGNFGIACIEGKKGQLYIRGQVLIDYSAGVGADGIQALDSHMAIADFVETSTGLSTAGTGIELQASRMSGEAFGGGVYSITNAKYGVNLSNGGEITDAPTITGSVTADYIGVLYSQKGPTNLMAGSGYGIYVNDFSTTPTFDVSLGSTQKITLTDNVTSSSIINSFDGANLTFQICQDGGGSNTFAWPADVLGADTIGSTGSKCNVQRFTYDATAIKWYATGSMIKDQ